jgi:hypothetical protein
MNPDFPSKPPLGLRPRIIADHIRAIEVHEALGRALAIHDSGGGLQSIPYEWAEELADIISRHQPKP